MAKATQKPADSTPGVPALAGQFPVSRLEWRRVEGTDRVYLVATMTDGSERKVTTPDGHVPAF